MNKVDVFDETQKNDFKPYKPGIDRILASENLSNAFETLVDVV